MEIKYLSDDDLEIELEVRKLVVTEDGITGTLKLRLQDHLDEEKADPSKIPDRPHEAAKKNPKREIQAITKKMDALLLKIILQDQEGNINEDQVRTNLNTMMAQLLHIDGRLRRIAYSQVIRKQLPGVYKAQQRLMKLVKAVLSEEMTIPDAIVAAAGITIPEKTKDIEKDTEVAEPQEDDNDDLLGDSDDDNEPGLGKKVSGTAFQIGEEMEDRKSFKNTLLHLKNELEDHLAQFEDEELKHKILPKLAGGIRRGSEVSDEVGELLLPLDAKICRDPNTWNLKFEGTRSNMHVERFFYRVERMALKSKISLNGLVDYMSLLLSGEALEWFWTYLERNKNVTWNMLKNEMIQRFQASRSDDDVRRMLGQRKQMYPKESFLDFHDAIMKIALQAKKPITDQEIYNYLRRNMRPGLQLELFEQKHFPSVSHFVRKCVSLEDLWRRFGVNPESKLSVHNQGYTNQYNNNYNNYQRGNRFPPRVHEMAEEKPVYCEDEQGQTDDDYDNYEDQDNQVNAIYNNNNQNGRYQKDIRSSQPQQLQRGRPTVTILRKPDGQRTDRERKINVCWNCSEPGHTFFDCRTPVRHVFCYGCGAKGIYKPDCQKCLSNSENYKPELRNNRESQLVTGARPKTMMNPNTKVMEEAAANTDPELHQRL